jgi:hypothetical protein
MNTQSLIDPGNLQNNYRNSTGTLFKRSAICIDPLVVRILNRLVMYSEETNGRTVLPKVQESRGIMECSRGTVVQSRKAVDRDVPGMISKQLTTFFLPSHLGALISRLSKLHPRSRSNYTMIANLHGPSQSNAMILYYHYAHTG